VKSPKILSIVSDLIKALTGERPSFENINAAAASLSEVLGARRILMIIFEIALIFAKGLIANVANNSVR
jgi:hypothetical protein